MDKVEPGIRANEKLPFSTGSQNPQSAGQLASPKPMQKSAASSTLYFSDGKRRIDFVLVYDRYARDATSHAMRREYADKLLEAGLDIELEDAKKSRDGATYFLKVHAPWDVLTHYAEILHFSKPIKKQEILPELPVIRVPQGEKPILPDINELLATALPLGGAVKGKAATRGLWDRLLTPFPYNHRLIPDETPYYNADFQQDKESFFIMMNRETFFSYAERSLITWEVLTRTSADERDRGKGLYRMLSDGVFLAAYPLHDGPVGTGPFNPQKEVPTDRRLLYSEWARPAAWYKQQPLWLIRRYFGAKTALYFAWIGFYTSALFPPAIVGLMTTIYGVSQMSTNTPTRETCDPSTAGRVILCPKCERRCAYEYLASRCTFSKIVYLFDNPATVAFSVFVAFWATTFMELWKRKQAVLGWGWHLTDIDSISEVVNPEYEAKATVYKLNPVTMRYEPYVPTWEKILRVSGTATAVLFMLCLVICTIFGIIVYRIILVALLSRDREWRALAHVTTAISASVLNLAIIMLMNRMYRRLATKLTDIERPRTQRDYEDSYTFKMFLFTFINTYSSLIYISFFKGRFSGTPDKPGTLFGYALDTCEGGCLYEVCVQLAVIMIGQQVISQIQEIGQPLVMNWWNRWRRHGSLESHNEPTIPRWEADYDLQEWTTLSLFDEYLEMAVQFGFVTLFVAAFPLAPLFSLLNNIAEIRLDAFKYIAELRRPLAQRVPDIGAWQVILEGVCAFAVVCNAFQIAYTTDFIPRLVYKLVYSEDSSLRGFVNFTLSTFDTDDFGNDTRPENGTLDGVTVKECRYLDYREPPGSPSQYRLTLAYWHIFSARLLFVVIFEHVVFTVTNLIAGLIPDVPASVGEKIQRERVVTHELYEQAEERKKSMRGSRSSSMIPSEIAGITARANPPATALTSRAPDMRTQQPR